MRIYAIDDHGAVLQAIRAVVAATDGAELVGTASSGEAALADLLGEGSNRRTPELLLIDVQLGGMNGAETARRYRAAGGTAVIVLMSAMRRTELPADIDLPPVADFVDKSSLSPAVIHMLWRRHDPSNANAGHRTEGGGTGSGHRS